VPDRGDELFARGNPERYRPAVDGHIVRLPVGSGGIRRPKVSRPEQDRIGLALRGLYGELLEEPVPDHLADLIRRLK
jgi:hypothetical protein